VQQQLVVVGHLSVSNMEPKTIKLTDKAKLKIKDNLAKRGRGIGIKVGVRTTGCSGLAYTIEYIDILDEKELYWIGGNEGFMIVSTKKDFVYLENMTIDYVRNGLNEGFEFVNPNEKDRCGCGESFRI
jgi:iron-sulfur cluster assembly protein